MDDDNGSVSRTQSIEAFLRTKQKDRFVKNKMDDNNGFVRRGRGY